GPDRRRHKGSGTRVRGVPHRGLARTSSDSARWHPGRNRQQQETARPVLPFALRSTQTQLQDPAQPSDGRQPAETSASPSVGEHLVSRYHVVGIFLVFSQALVKHLTMGVTQWHRGGLGG